ncbi:BTB/POZ and MATH domain-containing protein 1 [Dichanthelium oligosanthes]|uniref:BTB/POZ and MATH domain-containing protein 1 n=1 Tax=Dichanthelium oligosanthes TaxID=888268 RepID=A0A1E5VJ91_9POAL|nr:BTB/POZ and MATH domain-containing protein 1 [Dichanthelium oligosanthes]
MIWRFQGLIGTSALVEQCAVYGYITVTCGLAVLRHNPIPVPTSTYFSEMHCLRPENDFGEPDVVFALDDDESTFNLHRKVLAARSPVFKAELEGPMAESSLPIIRPQHKIKAPVFTGLIIYMYHDRLPKDTECGGPSVELFRELLAAADWYAMDRLKLLCAKKLWDDYMSVETVSKTLWYADTYNCRELKDACMHLLNKGENMKQVAVSKEYIWLAQNSPEIIDEELRARVMAKFYN